MTMATADSLTSTATPAPTSPIVSVSASASASMRTHRATWMTATCLARLCARRAPRYSSVSILGSVAMASSSRIGVPYAA